MALGYIKLVTKSVRKFRSLAHNPRNSLLLITENILLYKTVNVNPCLLEKYSMYSTVQCIYTFTGVLIFLRFLGITVGFS